MLLGGVLNLAVLLTSFMYICKDAASMNVCMYKNHLENLIQHSFLDFIVRDSGLVGL